jgi:hypothetical protein
MTLPISRNTTYGPGSPVKSSDLNDIQDAIVGAKYGDLPWTTSAIKGADYGAAWTYDNATARFKSTGAGSRLVTLDLNVGDHLTGLEFQVSGDGVADVTAFVFFINAAGALTNIGTLAVANPGALAVQSIAVTETELTANGSFLVEFAANAANIQIGNIAAPRYRP